VTYSNEAKVRLLNLREDLLEAKGAVSRAVVLAMARGAAKSSGADYALAASGIAGPGGGTEDKPVGTVEIACHSPEGTYYRRLSMRPYWGRIRIRQVAAHHCLALLLKVLESRHQDDPKVEGPFEGEEV
jgi:PncC family amidohydrolase